MLFFPPSLQVNLEPGILDKFLKQITALTGHFLKLATQKAQLDDDSTIYFEAFEHMLEAWVSGRLPLFHLIRGDFDLVTKVE